MGTYNNRHRFKFLIPFGIAALLALVSFVVMQLWNNLLPDILHVSTITFWQAMGIFILCKILFGFGGGPRGGGAPWMRRKRMMEEKFRNMSPEERLRFKQHWQDRCGWGKRRADWANEFKEEPVAAPHQDEAKTE
ncbi:hypothetical protein ACFQZX_17905 [Mucilaginibacter litoreus]|uniref:Uncharacterized protein n=1 Tax=Mucilaginibacter litoreus TaxID=1048221 RepID=A0ABW3AY83_9SPHI